MAYDKAVDSAYLDGGLTAIADAIRAKGGTAAPLEFPQDMADAVAAISGGGGSPIVHGVVTLPDASREIDIPLPAGATKTGKWAVICEHKTPDYTVNGNVGFAVVNGLPYINIALNLNDSDTNLGVVFETRTAYATKAVIFPMTKYGFDADLTVLHASSRSPQYIFQAGEYDYYVIPSEVSV